MEERGQLCVWLKGHRPWHGKVSVTVKKNSIKYKYQYTSNEHKPISDIIVLKQSRIIALFTQILNFPQFYYRFLFFFFRIHA